MVDKLAKFMKNEYPTMKGFNRRGIYRMNQFYEIYKDNLIVSPLVTQFSWTNNIMILSSTNSMEEKEFYIRMCIKNNYSKRELNRQILDLPNNYCEKDLKRSIISNMKDFILEIGKGFTFIGEENRVQVGGEDFYIDYSDVGIT